MSQADEQARCFLSRNLNGQIQENAMLVIKRVQIKMGYYFLVIGFVKIERFHDIKR